MAINVHKVPKKQWAKWNKDEQATFNRLWLNIYPELLPTGVKLTKAQFNALRWNVCWTAASTQKELSAKGR